MKLLYNKLSLGFSIFEFWCSCPHTPLNALMILFAIQGVVITSSTINQLESNNFVFTLM